MDYSKFKVDAKTLEGSKENFIKVVNAHYPKLSPKDRQGLVDHFYPEEEKKKDEKVNRITEQPKGD